MANVMARWRDDKSPNFYPEKTQEISGELDWVYFHVPGMYRARQYEISFSENLPFTLLRIEEEVEVLDY